MPFLIDKASRGHNLVAGRCLKAVARGCSHSKSEYGDFRRLEILSENDTAFHVPHIPQAVTLASLQQLRAAALAESGGGGGGGGGTAAKVSPSSSSYGADQIVVVQHDAALDLMAAATSAAGTASVKTHASRMVRHPCAAPRPYFPPPP